MLAPQVVITYESFYYFTLPISTYLNLLGTKIIFTQDKKIPELLIVNPPKLVDVLGKLLANQFSIGRVLLLGETCFILYILSG